MNLSIEMLGILLLVSCVGALLGAGVVLAWSRRKENKPESPADRSPGEQAEPAKQEAQRYFLMNETGNVLISTSLSPTGSLPEATIQLFSEALAHLAAVFYAVAGTNDPVTEKPFSLYNYWALKRALERHPAFIRVSTENTDKPAPARSSDFQSQSEVQAFSAVEGEPQETEELDYQGWLEERVKQSRNALKMDESPANVVKLQTIHSQLRAEAQRLEAKMSKLKFTAEGVESFAVPPQFDSAAAEAEGPVWSDLDKMEIGHITLYCECLMGVSMVTVKLAHARYDHYLKSDSMEEDIYLFVSSSQLKQTMSDVNSLPRLKVT